MTQSIATRCLACPDCEGTHIKTVYENHSFEYGENNRAVTLKATIPVHYCQNSDCQEIFLGEQAMKIRHEEICRYLGILSPSDIRQLRVKKGGAVGAFSKVTGIGTATIQRWEAGQIFQSKSQDNYLRLLARNDNYDFLSDSGNTNESIDNKNNNNISQKKFRSFGDDAMPNLIAQRNSFELRHKKVA